MFEQTRRKELTELRGGREAGPLPVEFRRLGTINHQSFVSIHVCSRGPVPLLLLIVYVPIPTKFGRIVLAGTLWSIQNRTLDNTQERKGAWINVARLGQRIGGLSGGGI